MKSNASICLKFYPEIIGSGPGWGGGGGPEDWMGLTRGSNFTFSTLSLIEIHEIDQDKKNTFLL